MAFSFEIGLWGVNAISGETPMVMVKKAFGIFEL
jgi:hypothetical protein